ncbi:MAG: D-alanine--D-alanine ligase [Proteobacteria bacterium]|nr:D-alanine--D-alanine ligase [Pseudomonadota bacterium]MBU1964247.1 D-alanine--D-alanine ligase [Pseudomonadota bacterium]MBU4372334.1 D-alanine--D-alanine ligase [Pseudomonadota bacterium]MBU4581629.1 D-alanine--D-alanine ligase [Pseudomonadota bacterium]
MKIGITYDLRDDYIAEGYTEEETAEFDHPLTIDAIEEALRDLGYETNRIGHIRALTRRLVAGDRWDLVFNIAEGLRGFGREAQVPALLDAWEIPYTFSDPLLLSLTLHKGLTKRVIRDLGIPTPDFAVVETPEQIEAVALPFPLFAKPVAEGTGKGVTAASKIADPAGLDRVCRELLAVFRQPVLVETFLPGREFTVGIIGTGKEAFAPAVMEVHLTEKAEKEVYSYANKEDWHGRIEYRLAADAMARAAVETALAAWRGLGCRDGGRVDLRADAEGIPHFMEINPLAGLRPGHSDLPILCELAGMSYRELIAGIMRSALKRL